MSEPNQTVSLSSWAGGQENFEKLFDQFYARVARHDVLAPIFAGMDPHHAQHVAAFVNEVLGGKKAYSEDGGSHAAMIMRHMDKRLTHTQRKAWIALLLETADDVGLPDDPEFRASFVGYLEWGSRLAVLNSAEGVEAPASNLPMPLWTWASPGGPYAPE